MSFASLGEWEAWLEAEGRECAGIWLRVGKKGSGVASLTRNEAVDGALCFGWIDGQQKPFDGQTWLVRFTARRVRSKWSQVNRARVEELIAAGRVRAAGLAEVERAKADGRWEAAYPAASQATVPEDLRAALDANPAAGRFFETLRGVNRYAVLYRIHDAKTERTRAARIEKFVGMLARGEVVYPDVKIGQ